MVIGKSRGSYGSKAGSYRIAWPPVRRKPYLAGQPDCVTVRFLFLFFLGILSASALPAQSPSYIHYGVSEGLPSNNVYCVIQDHRGFIWFGTDKGLSRFDGTRFQVYGVKEGLPDPEILGLFEDSRQRLWISCFSQRPCYLQNGRLVTAKSDSLLAQINVESSLWGYSEDAQRRIWIAGKTPHVFIFDGKSITKECFPETVVRVEQLGPLQFGLGTASVMQKDKGVNYLVNPGAKNFKSLAVSKSRMLYSLTGQLILLEWRNGQVAELDRIAYTGGRVFKDHKGRFWHCPDSKGSICFDNPGRDLSNPIVYLPQEQVNAMLEDRHGTLWFCTSGHGVYALSPGKAATYTEADGLATNNITALAYRPPGEILAGDDGGNLYKIRGKTIEKTLLGPVNEHNRSRQIIPLPDDKCWVANDEGLYYQHGPTFQKVDYIKGSFGSFKTILADHERIWYGNHNSLGYVNPDRKLTLVTYRRTTALGRDADGNIWAGRLDGLYSQRDSFQYNWGDSFPALKSRIVAVAEGGPGKLWIVTPDGGLLLGSVKNGALTGVQRIQPYLQQAIENIQSIYIDPAANGRVWMATNRGVYGLQPADWSVVHYDQHDGLADDDVNCVLVARDTLWAGTVGGLSYIPLALQSGSDDFGTFVTGLHYQSAGRPVFLNLLDSLIPAHRVIVLPPDAVMATLNLAGLNYRSQGNLSYECVTTKTLPPMRWWTRANLYTWIKNGFRGIPESTIIGDNNLNFGISFPSGSYQLKITAITTQGAYSRAPDAWTIIMQPHWYNTVWFDLLLWGLIAYAFWLMLHARIDYRKLNIAVSELQLQALQSQINPHFVGNSINGIQQFFYPPNPAAASNYIELFTRLLRRTIILSEQHFNSLEEELAYDRDYLQMIKLRFGERFQYDIIGADQLPGDLPFPSMLLQPILENATIHGLAPEGISRLLLQFSCRNRELYCSVTDNGMGYNASRLRPTNKPVEQKSKGLELLEKKVIAFNQLYDVGLRLDISDLADEETPGLGTGTRGVIAFNPEKIKTTHRASGKSKRRPTETRLNPLQ